MAKSKKICPGALQCIGAQRWSAPRVHCTRPLHSVTAAFLGHGFTHLENHVVAAVAKKKLIVKIRNIEDSKFSYKPFFFNYF